jgi:hypothetical protein
MSSTIAASKLTAPAAVDLRRRLAVAANARDRGDCLIVKACIVVSSGCLGSMAQP